jgi:Spy/CpxP family protein refolding chaperone
MNSSRRTSSKRIAIILAIAALSIWAVWPAAAQPGPGPHGQRPMRERVESVIIGKFATELDLTPEQAEKFFPRFKQFQDAAQDLHHQQMEQRHDMDSLAHSEKADGSRLQSLMDQKGQTDQQLLTLRQNFLKDVTQFLSPQQVSRCSIMLDDLPRRLQKFIDERRHGRNDDDDNPQAPIPDRPRRRGY